MPTLTDAQIKDMGSAAVTATMTRSWDGVTKALKPLYEGGDAGDGYLLITLLIHVVLDGLAMPDCPQHGQACVKIDFSQKSDRRPFDPPTPVDDEKASPAQLAFMALVRAEFDDDPEASILAFCEALKAGTTVEVLYLALRNAANTMAHRLSGLQ